MVGNFMFDSNIAIPWVTEWNETSRSEEVILDFGILQRLQEIRMNPGSGNAYAVFPRDFKFDVSKNGKKWEPLFADKKEFEQLEQLKEGEWISFSVTDDKNCNDSKEVRFIRLHINQTQPFNSGYLCAISEMELRVPEVEKKLKIRDLFSHNGQSSQPVIGEEAALPGELTQSLCSPWQHDYRDCGCYYWAASRPDYVNVDAETGKGHNWMDTQRQTDADGNPIYSDQNIEYEDIYQNWEQKETLKFQIDGKDED